MPRTCREKFTDGRGRSSQIGRSAPRLRKAPRIERVGERETSINLAEPDQLETLIGKRTFEEAAIVRSGLNSFGERGFDYLELVPAVAVEMEPQDAVEAMLVTQMAATHFAMTQMSLKMHHAPSCHMQESYAWSMTRLSRTYLAQMEQLKKYRVKAQ